MKPESFDDGEDDPVDGSDDEVVAEDADASEHEAQSADVGADWSPRPSQDKLHEDQLEALTAFVKDGYASRRAFLEGLHDMIWHSLGRLDGNWFAELGRDDAVLSVVITDDSKRTRYRDDPVSLAAARRSRRRIAKKFVRPAFRAAFREMRANADEHILEDERTNPQDASMFAMRPSMEFLRERQRNRLRDLLDGFADRDALDRWLHRLDGVTLGEIDRVDPDIDWRIEMQPVTERALLGNQYRHERQRETFAAFYFLPACAYTPQLLLDRAKELREDPDTKDMTPTNL